MAKAKLLASMEVVGAGEKVGMEVVGVKLEAGQCKAGYEFDRELRTDRHS
jgi:hypothetical protein